MFLHVDMDSFFVSCEIASFPHLKGKPVVVSTGYNRKGVVASASYEARKFGIKSGMPIYMAKSILPGLYIIEANLSKYAAISDAIMQVLKKYAPEVEVYSIDEAYLKIDYYKKDPIGLAIKIKSHIKRNFNLPLTIGIGTSRVVAKTICKKSKPDGIGMVKSEDTIKFMGTLDIEDIPGIGKKSAEMLKKYGIHRGVDLQNAKTDLLQKIVGVRGIWFKKLARGEDAGYFLPTYSSTIKSIGHSETLPDSTMDTETLENYLLYLSIKVSRRAYRLKKMGNGISIHLRFSDFSNLSKQKQTSKYLYKYDDIYMAARLILSETKIKKTVRLIGISIYNLIPLIRDNELFNTKSTSDVLYKIYQKYGDFSVIPLSLLNINTLPKSIPPKIR